jgi:hypothetical protein
VRQSLSPPRLKETGLSRANLVSSDKQIDIGLREHPVSEYLSQRSFERLCAVDIAHQGTHGAKRVAEYLRPILHVEVGEMLCRVSTGKSCRQDAACTRAGNHVEVIGHRPEMTLPLLENGCRNESTDTATVD